MPEVMTSKRTALAELVATTLRGFDQRWRVEEHYQEGAVWGASEQEQKALMGSPARYAEVLYMEDDRPAHRTVRGRPTTTQERLWVQVWMQVYPGSDEQWDRIWKGGLVAALYDARTLRTEEGAVLLLGDPERPRSVPRQAIRQGVFCHFGELTITVTG